MKHQTFQAKSAESDEDAMQTALESALRRIDALERALANLTAVSGIGPISRIVSQVAHDFNVTERAIMGRDTYREVSDARQEVYLRCIEAGMSSSRIGRAMGRDHSTVIYGAEKAAARRAEQ